MSELLQREDISVDVENVVVVFRVAEHSARFSYPTGFNIAQKLRLVSGVAARIAGANPEERFEMKRQEAPHELNAGVELDGVDGSGWDAWNEGELVAFQFGGTIARFEADKGMTLASWFRQRSREAKRNAGDTSETLRIAGILTDANENARLNRR